MSIILWDKVLTKSLAYLEYSDDLLRLAFEAGARSIGQQGQQGQQPQSPQGQQGQVVIPPTGEKKPQGGIPSIADLAAQHGLTPEKLLRDPSLLQRPLPKQ